MEAAEKIPKKLYVYLDTTRGPGDGHGGQAVHRGRPGAGLRHQRQRGVWGGVFSFIIMKMGESASVPACSGQQSVLLQEEQHQAQGQQVGAAAGAEMLLDVLLI